jgi:hypothetical protein
MKATLMKQLLVLSFVSCIFFSCKNEDSKDHSKEEQAQPIADKSFKNYNISILLDLSDRISPQKYPNTAMQFYQRDLGYINSIAEAFTNHTRSKKTNQIHDQIQIFFNPEPQNQEINAISEKLKFKFDKSTASKENINKVITTYKSETAKIYDLAIKDNNYVGSDIWKFFANNVSDFCMADKHRNILIILTDGYVFYKDTKIKEENLTSYLLPEMIRTNGLNKANWKEKIKHDNFGFLPANEDLSNIEILVLGINPDKKNPYEGAVIKQYWTNWFTKMKVKRFEIKETGLPSNMDKVIKDFIN